ncbi:MAG: S26 family signal peptidase [Armatimonadetes bacterium]|nr:S26 family signal peptidase [Armatimonadota bacterium]
MPGRDQCAVCSTSLSAKSPADNVVPPRAKDRTISQRIDWTLANAPGVGTIRREIEGISLKWFGRPWAWLTPRAFGLILLSAIPGFAHVYLVGQRLIGGWLFALSVAMLALAAVLIKSPVSNWLLYCIVGLSMFSMSAGIDELRGGRRDIRGRLQAWIGIGLMVFSLYLGGYWTLRMAASPFASVVSVVAQPDSELVQRGDALLLWSRGRMDRGDMVVGTIQWQDYHALTIGRLVGLPGDRIEIGNNVRVNGKATAVRLPSLAGAHGEPVAYSAYDVSARTLRKDEYWIVPNFNFAPSIQDILEAGSIRRTNIWGRVVVIIGPPERRRIVQREPMTAE